MLKEIPQFKNFYCNECKMQVKGELYETTFEHYSDLEGKELEEHNFRYGLQSTYDEGCGEDVGLYMCPSCCTFKVVIFSTIVESVDYRFIACEEYPIQKANDFKYLEVYDKEDLDEIYKMFNQGIYGPMINSTRTLLQKIVRKELEESEQGNLYREIESLYKNGIITKTLKDVAHEIRCIGNSYVHPRGENSKEELKDDAEQILELLENLILMIIEIPSKLNKSKQ